MKFSNDKNKKNTCTRRDPWILEQGQVSVLSGVDLMPAAGSQNYCNTTSAASVFVFISRLVHSSSSPIFFISVVRLDSFLRFFLFRVRYIGLTLGHFSLLWIPTIVSWFQNFKSATRIKIVGRTKMFHLFNQKITTRLRMRGGGGRRGRK